jgi:gamma-glutamyl:cysteine ligase YbdK (ATP-grasp superfamily)
MGIEIDKTSFAPGDYPAFHARLEENLAALDELVADPAFGLGPRTLGAELEMYIVDGQGNPLHANQEIMAQVNDPQLTLELNRYNLEFNLSPYAIDAQPFAATEREILDKLQGLRAVAAEHGGRIVPIGILPTLRPSDFGSHCVTDRRRYHALVNQLLQRRGDKFRIDINGENPLKMDMEDITLEGANTSFQVHYRVAPADYADTYNAIQLMTPLALAIGANSPTLFGHSLWHETRIPLFKQSIDTRHVDRYGWNEPPRVNFGQGWARRDAVELFREAVRLYPPLLPICAAESSQQELAQGLIPSLAELRLHQSTVWLWNRPIYDDADGGMLRIEMRSLPAGPSAVDMVANAAFLIGLAEGVRPRINELLPGIPFGIAEYNFYRAAQHGLDARLVWPDFDQSGYREQGICSIIERLLPLAQQGLDSIGVSAAESSHYLGVIQRRLERRQTGAIWQCEKLAALGQSMSREAALHELLETFIHHSLDNQPVADWQL